MQQLYCDQSNSKCVFHERITIRLQGKYDPFYLALTTSDLII